MDYTKQLQTLCAGAIYAACSFIANACLALCTLVPQLREIRQGRSEFAVKRISRHLDVYDPDAADPASPVLVFIHGGGWISGSIRSGSFSLSYEFVGRGMASRGVRTALVGYPLGKVPVAIELGVYVILPCLCAQLAKAFLLPLLPLWVCFAAVVVCSCLAFAILKQRVFSASRDFRPGARFPEQLAAVREAVAALRQLYPSAKLVVAGHSAGGHMAALVGLSDCRPDVVIGLSGVYDLDAVARMSPVAAILMSYVFDVNALEQYSPISVLTAPGAADRTRTDTKWCIVSPALDSRELLREADDFTAELALRFRHVHRVVGIGLGHGSGMVMANATWALVEFIVKSQ